MHRAGGYCLNVGATWRDSLLEAIEEGETVAEVVPDFQHSRNVELVCFVSFEPGFVTHLALGKRGMRAGTGRRRLNLRNILQMESALSHAEILERVPARVENHVASRLHNGGLLPKASFAGLLEALRQISPSSRAFLDRFSEDRWHRIQAIPHEARRSLAFQKEAVATALTISGIDRSELQGWTPPDGTASFLDGLRQVRSREDAVVVNDLMHIPGFDMTDSRICGAAMFEREGIRLTIVLANHQPLELQTGADLIYFNETYRSFVCVQYKMMEHDSAGASFFRIPDEQLAEETTRMRETLEKIAGIQRDGSLLGFRILENPFFLKFCPRMNFEPDNTGLSPGMYLPLDLWDRIETDAVSLGPRGGKRITFKNIGRYLDNTDFVKLISKAWIGTTSLQSELLVATFRDVIESGRAAIVAVRHDVRPWRHLEDSNDHQSSDLEFWDESKE